MERGSVITVLSTTGGCFVPNPLLCLEVIFFAHYSDIVFTLTDRHVIYEAAMDCPRIESDKIQERRQWCMHTYFICGCSHRKTGGS